VSTLATNQLTFYASIIEHVDEIKFGMEFPSGRQLTRSQARLTRARDDDRVCEANGDGGKVTLSAMNPYRFGVK
jgi:hypothetical protein